LKSGITLANFHADGKYPALSEILKNLDSDGAIAFAHIFKREFPIPSTPLAFAIFKFFEILLIFFRQFHPYQRKRVKYILSITAPRILPWSGSLVLAI
jgi:hypothetical protein